MGKRFYTIFFVPERAARVRRFTLSSFLLKGAGATLIIFVIVSLYLALAYLDSRKKLGEARYFKAMASDQKAQLETFNQKVLSLESQMERLRQLDEKLRTFFNLKKEQRKDTLQGTGSIALEESARGALPPDQMMEELSRLEREARLKERRLSELEKFVEKEMAFLAARPSLVPVSGRITSGFGPRISPFTSQQSMHEGIDIANQRGTPVVAPGAAQVIFVGQDKAQGRLVALDHGYGIITRYGHLDSILVKEGERVKRGQKIATIGNTGLSTGPHLHYEIQVAGRPVNPEKFVLE